MKYKKDHIPVLVLYKLIKKLIHIKNKELTGNKT